MCGSAQPSLLFYIAYLLRLHVVLLFNTTYLHMLYVFLLYYTAYLFKLFFRPQIAQCPGGVPRGGEKEKREIMPSIMATTLAPLAHALCLDQN